MKKLIFSIACICMCGLAGMAQEGGSVVPFQLGIVTPLGTNGIQSHLKVNRVSLNLLGGYSRGNTALELGGLYNVNLALTKGAQMAGIVNLSGHSMGAAQFAGLANCNKEQSGGTQFAGLANVVVKGNTGLQMAGFANVAREVKAQFSGIAGAASMAAVQLSGAVGVANVSKVQIAGIFDMANVVGVQISGAASLANKSKVQISGIFDMANLSKVQVSGGVGVANKLKVQVSGIAGVANVSEVKVSGFVDIANVTGVQVSGVAGVANRSKVQISGIVNMAKNTKVQVGGVLNVAKRVGTQVGLVNIADSCTGVPVGLISIVKKNGKREFEVAFSETLNTTVSFKLGVDRFYTIFSGGVHYIGSPVEYAYGIGAGTHLEFKNDWAGQIELVGYQVTDNGRFPDDMNMLAQLKLPVSKRFSNHFKVFFGPVLNLAVAKNAEHSIAPYSIWSSTDSDGVNRKFWIGVTAGVRF